MKGKAGKDCTSNNYSKGFFPNSLRVISSCLKTVSANATTVASTFKSAAVSISAASDDQKEQVTWAGFDKLELSPSLCKHVLLLGYKNGFQVLDVDDASNFCELVSRREDGPVTFLQMQPIPLRCNAHEGLRESFPLLLVVGGDDSNFSDQFQNENHPHNLEKDKYGDNAENYAYHSKAIQFYSLSSQCYVHALRFRSAVCMVRCSPRIIAVGLATQIFCHDALTLEKNFSVLTYPIPQMVRKGRVDVNIGYGPMAVGPRWLAYASIDSLLVTTRCLSPQTFSPPSVANPESSAISGSVVAHYAMESGKQLAAGILNLGDRGYKRFSKYCHELLPDANSSPSLISGSRAGTSSITDTHIAGVVVVKDFVSRAVISKFRAHSSPISALCFDPCGTLLVTASAYGNSIKIFRILPLDSHLRLSSQSPDWNSSYVHLYKFRRGIRAAIIQDICFSDYSQWIAVVSSKGTCHVYILSPFGGDVSFQNLNSGHEEHSLGPVLTSPWWSASSSTINQKSVLPPSPVTLSLVSRIRDNYSGLVNTVSNVAASVSGKIPVPSGAVAAVFHNSVSSSHQVKAEVNSSENLLVYTPSGHVVQHEILLSFMVDSDSDSRPYLGSFRDSQDVELSINIRPVKWWAVCRRSNWSESENFISEIAVQGQGNGVSNYLGSGTRGQDLLYTNSIAARRNSNAADLVRSKNRVQRYLSNAELQYNTGTSPIWQRPKISFCLIGPQRVDNVHGEYEIEKLPVFEVKIREKDLVPVQHFHSTRSAPNHRYAGRYSNSIPLELPNSKDNATEETIICHSKPASSSSESSDGGSSRRMHLLDMDHLNSIQSDLTRFENPHNYCRGGGKTGVDDKFSPLDNELGATTLTSCPEISSNSYSLNKSNKEEEDDMGESMFAELENDNETLSREDISMPSNCRGDKFNQAEGEKDDMLGDIFAAFGDSSQRLNPGEAQNGTDATCDAALSNVFNSRKNYSDEEEEAFLGSCLLFED